jgi:hypothetical protein
MSCQQTIYVFSVQKVGYTYNIRANTEPPATLQKSVYDELGRLKYKYLHGDETGALQKVDYTYNIRDWLTGINNPNSLGSDHFGMALGYNSGDEPAYNGNISEMHWKTGSFALSEYQFDYDGANRLTEAVFTGTGQVYFATNEYSHSAGVPAS